jgi:hypothetical protein
LRKVHGQIELLKQTGLIAFGIVFTIGFTVSSLLSFLRLPDCPNVVAHPDSPELAIGHDVLVTAALLPDPD